MLLLLVLSPGVVLADDDWGFDGQVEAGGEPTSVVEVLSGPWDRPARGGREAVVTLVVFSDYECPFCARLEPTLTALLERYGESIQIVARHNPLEYHAGARPAALAAEAAHAQDRFWEYHARLFAAQDDLSDETLIHAASKAGLDTDRFAADRASDAAMLAVEGDIAWARQVGARGTPATFVNGLSVGGARPLQDFVALIDGELERAERVRRLHPEMSPRELAAGLTALNLELREAPRPGTRLAVDLDQAAHIAGPDDALLTTVAFVDYRDHAAARELDTRVDALARLYGDTLRVAWVPRSLGLDPVDTWLAALALASADQGVFEPVHDCLLAATAEQTLGLCAPDAPDSCTESLDDIETHTRTALLGCGLDAAQVDAVSGAVDDATRERAEAGRRLAIRTGALTPNALHVNGVTFSALPTHRDAIATLDGELERALSLVEQIDADVGYPMLAGALLSQPRTHVPVDDRPVSGPDDAPVTVVEFTDLECPFCKKGHATMDALREAYGDQLRVVTAHMPLSFHPNARPAALAAWAAHQQGQFAAYLDEIFAHQKALSDATYVDIATRLGLDLDRFEADRASQAAADAVDGDVELAKRVGVTGTPSFFVNGRAVSGAQSVEHFARIFDEELALADTLRGSMSGDWYQTVSSQLGLGGPDARQHVDLRLRPTTGRDDALVTLVVAGCLMGDGCAEAIEQVARLRKAYSDKELRIAWLSVPRTGAPSAWPAARASRAAARQGKLFEFNAALVQRRDDPGAALWMDLADTLGLDADLLVADMASPAVEWAIDRDVADAARVGLDETPGWIVNGHRLQGPQTETTLVAAIDDELAAARQLVKKGTVGSAAEVYDHVTGVSPAQRARGNTRVETEGLLTGGTASATTPKKRARPTHQIALFVALDNPAAAAPMAAMHDLAQQLGATDGVELVVVPVTAADELAHRSARAALALDDLSLAMQLGTALHGEANGRDDRLREALEAIGQDADAVLAVLDDDKIARRLERAAEQRAALGVIGEPTFVVDGVPMRGVQSADELLRWVGR